MSKMKMTKSGKVVKDDDGNAIEVDPYGGSLEGGLKLRVKIGPDGKPVLTGTELQNYCRETWF